MAKVSKKKEDDIEFESMVDKYLLRINRKDLRDHFAGIAIPITLRNFGTLEGATEAAYKVADLMLIESDKFKP